MKQFFIRSDGYIIVTRTISVEAYAMLKKLGYNILFMC